VAEQSAVEIVVYGSEEDLERLDGDEEIDDAVVCPSGGAVLLVKSVLCGRGLWERPAGVEVRCWIRGIV
jgi:hypothetical protein